MGRYEITHLANGGRRAASLPSTWLGPVWVEASLRRSAQANAKQAKGACQENGLPLWLAAQSGQNFPFSAEPIGRDLAGPQRPGEMRRS